MWLSGKHYCNLIAMFTRYSWIIFSSRTYCIIQFSVCFQSTKETSYFSFIFRLTFSSFITFILTSPEARAEKQQQQETKKRTLNQILLGKTEVRQVVFVILKFVESVLVQFACLFNVRVCVGILFFFVSRFHWLLFLFFCVLLLFTYDDNINLENIKKTHTRFSQCHTLSVAIIMCAYDTRIREQLNTQRTDQIYSLFLDLGMRLKVSIWNF